jgi:limonene-1,2-epoxide hydrolase
VGVRFVRNADLIAFIRRFIDACMRADPDDFASYFTEDATWWNSAWQPIKCRDAIRDTLRLGAERMTALPWEIRHILAAGDVVMTERVDHFLVGNNRISVPCMGVFELRRNARGHRGRTQETAA